MLLPTNVWPLQVGVLVEKETATQHRDLTEESKAVRKKGMNSSHVHINSAMQWPNNIQGNPLF